MTVLYIRNSTNTDWLAFYSSSGSSMELDDLTNVSSGSGLGVGDVLMWNGTEWYASDNVSVPRIMTMSFSGELSTTAGDQNKLRFYNQAGRTLSIVEVFCCVDTAPTDDSIIVDLHKDGATIFTNQAHRPTIAASTNTVSVTGSNIDDPTFADGSYLQMVVDQVGATVKGSDLVVHVMMQ